MQMDLRSMCFRFLTTNLRRKWIAAIHRDAFSPTKYSKVCELHFPKEDVLKHTECFDETTGRKIVAPLYTPRLRAQSVPSIFPNCPQYLTVVQNKREDPEARRIRLDNSAVSAAISESLCTYKMFEERRRFTTFSELMDCLERETFSECWTVVKKKECVLFAFIDTSNFVPFLSVSACITCDLEINVFKEQTALKTVGSHIFPKKIQDIGQVNNILELLLSISANVQSTQDNINIICDVLQNVSKVTEGKERNIEFLMEQVRLLPVAQERLRYSPEFIVFCAILFSISPHAYRFMRKSHYMSVPHPRTLQKICLKFGASPQKEQVEDNFLAYVKQKFSYLKTEDHVVSLMIDEMHIKPYLDYKGGNILGTAFNGTTAASSVYVFMIQSLLSSFKEVVHILPVNTLQACDLFTYVKNVITGLHSIGFKVICVVTDNNSINRKCMAYFSTPPKKSVVYPHPSDPSSPLFFIINSVHVLKCIRNNWINQKDAQQVLTYPNFENMDKTLALKIASFSTLKKLHALESKTIIKYSYGLCMKSLCPSNFERQNVKYALNVFNPYVVQGLLTLGEEHNLYEYQSTADFITLIENWWSVVNVQTKYKGERLKNSLKHPLTVTGDEDNFLFLNKFLNWLDVWDQMGLKYNCLTRDTHWALSNTTHGLIEMAKYCINELGFKYFLPGKIQTDALEARFGNYRTYAGSQYLVSLRQVFETECKIRLQHLLPLQSSFFGNITVSLTDTDEQNLPTFPVDLETTTGSSISTVSDTIHIEYSPTDVKEVEKLLPLLTYLSGYCTRIALKRLKCEFCASVMVLDRGALPENSACNNTLIAAMDRGGLLYPHLDMVNAVMYNYITVLKLIESSRETAFLRHSNQRELVIHLTTSRVNTLGFFLPHFTCKKGHCKDRVLSELLLVSTNILLNDYVKKFNECSNAKKKRKVQTLS
ncbi:uncharacterized protein LOC126481016 [Schistocerca serialis cubense]|uniref:uncharacterized protein LOC126481016 n=1 Tax=Schistocerca serialis cubense TaxID=2023355 RepID=UPI00214EAD0C|nr:uncharacterized protein LOC126481016 [Schistocerca serialis cubense]